MHTLFALCQIFIQFYKLYVCSKPVAIERNSPVIESRFSVGLILEPREGWIVTSSM